MAAPLKNPIVAFLEWYRSLAMGQRQYLAHLYVVLTTENTTELAMAGGCSPEKFEHVVTKRDFPLRMVSRMVVVRAIIDFIFINKDHLVQETPMSSEMVNIADKQWEAGVQTWQSLRGRELSDRYINLWLQSELKVENGTDD